MDITEFLQQCASTAYPEPESPLHSQISEAVFNRFFESVYQDGGGVSAGLRRQKVLDVGCGSGFMASKFREREWVWTGCSLDQDAIDKFNQYRECELFAPVMEFRDMHNLGDDILWNVGRTESSAAVTYDLIWARHVLEHSPIPFKVLLDFKRLVKPGGYIYLEMPAPNTMSFHALNPNHYSCFDMNGWVGLIQKSGLEIVDYKDLNFQISPPGRESYQEQYYSFFLRKPLES